MLVHLPRIILTLSNVKYSSNMKGAVIQMGLASRGSLLKLTTQVQ